MSIYALGLIGSAIFVAVLAAILIPKSGGKK